MRFPRTISSPNKINNHHVLDPHVGPDFADGVGLGYIANNNTGKSSLKLKSHAVSQNYTPSQQLKQSTRT
jgi:hypothetical protein